MDINDKLSLAFKHYQEGNFAQAEKDCLEVLSVEPDNSEILHLLGMTYHFQGNNGAAVDYLIKALHLDAESADIHYDLGNVFHEQGKLREAQLAYEKAIEIEPENAEALSNLGMVFHDLGQRGEAIIHYQKALELAPNNALIHNNIALAYQENDERQKAIAHYGKAIQLEPQYADAYYNMGHIFMGEENLDQAFMYFRKSVEFNPGLTDAYVSMAYILVKKERYSEAIPLLKGLSIANPESAEIHNNLGNALSELWNMDEALMHLRRAVELNQYFAEAHNNHGNTLSKMAHFDEAIQHIERAIQLNPRMEEAFLNLGTVYKETGRFREASSCYRKTLLLDPDNPDARFNQALLDLLMGDFRKGWEGYEFRWKVRHARERNFTQPLWSRELLTTKNLFIYAEQGLGDEIMFGSCIPEMIRQAELCIIECDERLMPLYERSFPGIRMTKRIDGDRYPPHLPPAAYCIAAGSLPRYLRQNLESFPGQHSYLIPEMSRVGEWKKRYGELGEGLKIGISWRGGSKPDVIRIRSINLGQWSGLFSVPGVHVINLQHGDCREELKKAEEELGVRIYDWEDADPLKDLDGFAAKIAGLDLVISVDNSTVHLSGALGVPVWVLMPYVCEWRWMLDFEDTPWYDSVRLFRQDKPGEWGEVFEKMKERLSAAIEQEPFSRSTLLFQTGLSYKTEG